MKHDTRTTSNPFPLPIEIPYQLPHTTHVSRTSLSIFGPSLVPFSHSGTLLAVLGRTRRLGGQVPLSFCHASHPPYSPFYQNPVNPSPRNRLSFSPLNNPTTSRTNPRSSHFVAVREGGPRKESSQQSYGLSKQASKRSGSSPCKLSSLERLSRHFLPHSTSPSSSRFLPIHSFVHTFT